MTNAERTEAIEKLQEVNNMTNHSSWPSGLHAEGCTGCSIRYETDWVIDLLNKEVITDSPVKKKVKAKK